MIVTEGKNVVIAVETDTQDVGQFALEKDRDNLSFAILCEALLIFSQHRMLVFLFGRYI